MGGTPRVRVRAPRAALGAALSRLQGRPPGARGRSRTEERSGAGPRSARRAVSARNALRAVPCARSGPCRARLGVRAVCVCARARSCRGGRSLRRLCRPRSGELRGRRAPCPCAGAPVAYVARPGGPGIKAPSLARPSTSFSGPGHGGGRVAVELELPGWQPGPPGEAQGRPCAVGSLWGSRPCAGTWACPAGEPPAP